MQKHRDDIPGTKSSSSEERYGSSGCATQSMPLEKKFMGFSEWLRMYYDRLFPYEDFAEWLGYGQGQEYLFRREFSFTLENDQYIRYKCFRDGAALKSALTQVRPFKVDIGAVFSVPPQDKPKVPEDQFFPQERELVFDIDLTDYDDIRTCCQEASICPKCWKFMIPAVQVIEAFLQEDFGFRDRLWVYSGRRGIHCWVADERARKLENDARSAIVQYIATVEGGDKNSRKVVLKDPLHPALEYVQFGSILTDRRAYQILLPHFQDFVLGEQNALSTPERWSKILDMVPSQEIRSKLHESWCANSLEPMQKWTALKDAVQKALSTRKRVGSTHLFA